MNNNEIATINVYGNVWVREMVFVNKGDTKVGHKHQFDHLHFVAKGRINIQTKDCAGNILSEQEYESGSWIKVPKEVYHTIIAIEPMSVGYCIQALRDEDGEIMETDYLNDLEEESKCIDCSSPIQDSII